MNDQELLVLVAKDYVIKLHGFAVRTWSRQTWHSAVQGVHDKLPDDALIKAREVYGE